MGKITELALGLSSDYLVSQSCVYLCKGFLTVPTLKQYESLPSTSTHWTLYSVHLIVISPSHDNACRRAQGDLLEPAHQNGEERKVKGGTVVVAR